ncbi:hypothetical protein BGW38_010710 [Lunasporangiospora selenospora]|uniref:Transferase family protein n=1 Tax=Lunasporangiospora selenospora TaxID=979761 RepID=A0A9P6G2M0_9FUNG|nr:hypothetical protein BGW38_010710 [Lunasporangiospora selenospora]
MTLKTLSIRPTSQFNLPPPPPKIYLHGIDFSPPIQIRNNRFYHSSPITTSEVVENLKNSLAIALELVPPLSGTLKTNGRGEAYIATGEENLLETPFLVEERDSPYVGDSEDLSPRGSGILTPQCSPFAAKVTKFSCGTIAVASSINHQFVDLGSFLDFLELWASIARGEPIDFSKIPTDWTRTPGRFFPPPQPVEAWTEHTFPPPFKVLPEPVSGPPLFLMVPAAVSTFKFTKASMEQLRSDFSPAKDSEAHKAGLWISSGDALASLLCGAITRARGDTVARLDGRSSFESQTEGIAMAADGRVRASDSTMQNGQYFGNFNTLWGVTVSRLDLLSHSCESASRVALAIRDGLNHQLTTEAIAHKIAFFEDPRNTEPAGRISWAADLILTNWCRFDLQGPKLDLGWGKPFTATSGSGGAFPPGYCLMTQVKDTGDTFALITVEKDAADMLWSDSLLTKYGTRVPA